MDDEEKQKKLVDKAKEIFGITESCERAGYILPDGEMLDFGDPYYKDFNERYQDHSAVFQVYDSFPEIPILKPYGQCFNINLIDQWMLDTGAIRLSTLRKYQLNGEMFQPNTPTKRQYETLEYCNCMLKPEEVVVELSKCTDKGKYTPTNFLEQSSEGDCMEMINNMRKNINEWKNE